MSSHATPAPAPGNGITHSLAQWASRLRLPDVDGAAQLAARRHLLDTLGCLIAGSQQPLTGRVRDTLAALRSGGEVPVPGHSVRADLLDAIYLAGVAAHGLELDDGYRNGSSHPGAVVIPAALATAWAADADVQTLLEAVIAGYEAVTIVSRLAHPAMRKKGFHPTATSGVFGAAIAAAHLRQLPADRWGDALGIAASSAAGLFAFVSGGADVKRLHPGHAAREGVFAVLLAENGVQGPPAVLEGIDGFFQAFADPLVAAQSYVLPPQGPWGIASCYLKPYPCCRHLHPAIDAVFALMQRHRLHADEIKAVEVKTYGIAAEHAQIGWDDFASSQLSFPFVIATALRFGKVELQHFADAARLDPATVALCSRVQVSSSAAMDERYRSSRPARVTIQARGRYFSEDRSDAYGAPHLPMDKAAVEAKFRNLATAVIGSDNCNALIEHIWNAGSETRVRDLVSLTLSAHR